MKTSTKIIVILSILLLLTGYFFYQTVLEKKMAEASLAQNELNLTTAMQKIKTDSATWFQRYAAVLDLNKKQEKLLKDRNEKILALTEANIQLKAQVDSSGGQYTDTTHKIITFKNDNGFRKYIDSVFCYDPPWHKLYEEYIPFGLSAYLTRNTKGQWSGYLKFSPPLVNNFLQVNSLSVFVDKDEFVRVESDINKFRLSVMPFGELLMNGPVYFNAGGIFEINGKYDIGYSHGVGTNMQAILFGYRFDFIK